MAFVLALHWTPRYSLYKSLQSRTAVSKPLIFSLTAILLFGLVTKISMDRSACEIQRLANPLQDELDASMKAAGIKISEPVKPRGWFLCLPF
jgi:hypothetical protein